eukprot:CAMPEP_0173095664 /NCGR_PEP_ID=MMETSP1102-20130122/32169_1 /TAXON_ID=49646 /ORGANISM="Geminigera sp., Strain Caron Lab Isolate" /LENGTH=74 /DNA_ID=CAMNT_0013985811 /DNA_START=308 /DNA_END=528 /DNA_ORIENTATION=-
MSLPGASAQEVAHQAANEGCACVCRVPQAHGGGGMCVAVAGGRDYTLAASAGRDGSVAVCLGRHFSLASNEGEG